MIITNELAESMDKQTLSELATMYATEFASALGHKGIVRIGQNEMIYDIEEAEKFFLAKDERDVYRLSSDKSTRIYKFIQRQIAARNGFVLDNVAFIPINGLSADDADLINRVNFYAKFNHNIQINRKLPHSKTEPTGENKGNEQNKYSSLPSFGPELGHMVGNKLYGNRISDAVGEALDLASQFFEMSANTSYLCSAADAAHNLPFIKQLTIEKRMRDEQKCIGLYETLLFKGERAAKNSIIRKCRMDEQSAEYMLNHIINDFVQTKHYEGRKLFFEVYLSAGKDLSKAYKTLGATLSNPKVTNFRSALRAIGCDFAEAFGYDDEFETNLSLRAGMLEKRLEDIPIINKLRTN